MATAHLVYGFLGAGKTTFARELAKRERALRFSIDEWYLQLFADGPTYELDRDRFARVLELSNRVWTEVLAHGVDVVLDFGFWQRALRDRVRTLASSVGAESRLYWVRCSDDVALRRCRSRNGDERSFLISETGFEEMKTRFDALGADETFENVDG